MKSTLHQRLRRMLFWSVPLAGVLSAPAAAQDARPATALTIRDAPPPNPPRPPRPRDGAPNMLVILLDDAGFGQFATFGGAVPSPSMDALAANGLRYTRFHTAGICSPTRAALLTGRNPHNAGFGNVGEMSNGYDGYTGVFPDSAATFARVLQENGYATAMLGKNHNTPASEGGPSGPFNHWPTAMGFDYFYGFNGWGQDQWNPTLYEGTTLMPPSGQPGYTLSHDLAEHAIAWLHRTQSAAPDRPWLLYLAPGATHAPHQVPQQWADRFKGQFDKGWDAYREAAFARQKALGVIPATAELTPRPEAVPAWDSLTPDQKRIDAREMEVFAGFSAQIEYEVGRVIAAAQALPNARNTIIVYILGDNGGSAEGGVGGTISELAQGNGLGKEAQVRAEHLPGLGGPLYENHMAYGWAWAVDTPFRYYKQVVSHLGAIRNPMIVSWPQRIKDAGAIRTQFLDVADIGPTLLEAAGLAMPAEVDGHPQKPLDGVSALATLDSAKAPEVRHTQYFEVFANRAIYHRGWFASAKIADPWLVDRTGLDPLKVQWELYNLDTDFTQAHDLAASNPAKLREMENLWWAEAAHNNVLPLDWRGGDRLLALEAMARPAPTHYTYFPGTAGLPEKIAPVVRNRSWKITATGRFTPADQGVLVTQGGMPGGWAFRLDHGVPVFDYNLQNIQHVRIAATAPVPEGTKALTMQFAYDGAKTTRRGGGGTVTLLADGKVIGKGRMDRTLPNMFSVNETFDVGADYGSPVADYPLPAPFTGQLDQVTLDLE